MRDFEYKLACVLKESTILRLYKGISLSSGYNRYEHVIGERGICVPGFLSTFRIGRVYSEPTLTGEPTDPSLIIQVDISRGEVEDRTLDFMRWCDRMGQEYDISLGFPEQWRNGAIWTVNCDSSGHAGVSCFNNADFVFCGVEREYVVVRHYNNQQDWNRDNVNDRVGR